MIGLFLKKQNLWRYFFYFVIFFSCMMPFYAVAEEPVLPYFQDRQNSSKSLKNKDILIENLKSLHFLTSVDFPVFNYIDKSGYLVGYNIDLMRALCRELDLEDQCTIEALPFEQLVPHLLAGNGDAIIAGLKPSQNLPDVAFSSAYLKFPDRFVTLQENGFRHFDAKKMQGKVFGVLKGSAHEERLKQYFPTVTIQSYTNKAQLYKALIEGKITAIFADGLSLSIFLMSDAGQKCCQFSDGPYMFEDTGLRIAYAKKDKELGQIFTYALESLEQKGVLKELYMRYFPIGFY